MKRVKRRFLHIQPKLFKQKLCIEYIYNYRMYNDKQKLAIYNYRKNNYDKFSEYNRKLRMKYYNWDKISKIFSETLIVSQGFVVM